MSNHKLVKVLPGHRVEHQPDPAKNAEIRTHGDAPFNMTATHYAELGPGGLNAVRLATDADKAAGGNTDPIVVKPNLSTEELAALTPEHRGGGVWDVSIGEIKVVPQGFKSKTEAEAWITEQRKIASD